MTGSDHAYCTHSQYNNFWEHWRTKFVFAHSGILYGIPPQNTCQVHIWRSSGEVQGHIRRKKHRRFLFPQCKISSGHNYGYIKHRAMRFACNMGFSATADRTLWPPSLSRDRKWPRVTKCTHSRVVGLRLEGDLVLDLPYVSVGHLYSIVRHFWFHLILWKLGRVHNTDARYSYFVVIQCTYLRCIKLTGSREINQNKKNNDAISSSVYMHGSWFFNSKLKISLQIVAVINVQTLFQIVCKRQ